MKTREEISRDVENLNNLQKKYCRGYFKDFPPEIIFKLEKYLKRDQPYIQGAIDYYNLAIMVRSGYINFKTTPAGAEFWHDVLWNKNFARYFNRYPIIYFTSEDHILYKYGIKFGKDGWYNTSYFKSEEKVSISFPEESLYENIKLKKDGKRIY